MPDLRLVPQMIPSSSPSQLALTEDGKLALVGSHDGSVAVWQLDQRTLLRVIRAHEGEVVALATSGSFAWSIGRKDRGEQVTLCEIDLGRVTLRVCQGLGPGDVAAASVSRDGTRAAVVLVNDTMAATQGKATKAKQQRLVVVDLVHWKIQSSRNLARPDRVNALAFSPDGQTLASIGNSLVFMEADGTPRRQIPLDGVAIAFGASSVLVSRADWSLELRRSDTGELISRPRVESYGDLNNSVIGWSKRVGALIAMGKDRFVVITKQMSTRCAMLVDMTIKTSMLDAPCIITAESRLLVATNVTMSRMISIVDSDLVSFDSFEGSTRERISLPHRSVTAAAFTQSGIWIGGSGSLARIDPATAVVEIFDVPGVVALITKHNDDEFAIVLPSKRSPQLWRLRGALAPVRVPDARVQYQKGSKAANRVTAAAFWRERAAFAVSDWLGRRLEVFDLSRTRPDLAPDLTRGRRIYELGPFAISALAFTPDGRSLIAGARCDDSKVRTSCDVWRIDLGTGHVHRLGAHMGSISSISVAPDGRAMVTTSGDGTARIWRLDGRAAVNFVLDGDNWIMYGDDGVFDASRRGSALVAAVRGDSAFPLDQLAAVYNLPHQLLVRMGFGRPDVRQYFAYRHAARAAALGLALNSASRSFDVGPRVTLVHLQRNGKFVELAATLVSSDTELARYQIWVNQIPILPVPGVAVRGRHATISHRIELTPGDNRIEIAAYSISGIESLRAVQSVTYNAPDTGQLYVVALGVSKYRDPTLQLGLAARDARDIATLFTRFPRTHVLPALINEQVTLESLASVRAFLGRATVDDMVVVFIAGHGILSPDAGAEFLFVPYEFDRTRPRETAIPFSILEGLVEGVSARRRLLLIDSCVSGDRDEGMQLGIEISAADARIRARVIKVRSELAAGSAGPRLPREYIVNRDRLIFQNGARGSGVIAFSSSRWNELSYERDTWGNGAFTAEIVHALSDPATDTNGDQRVSFEELVDVVRSGVAARTGGLQHPTVRADNLDAGIWFPMLPIR